MTEDEEFEFRYRYEQEQKAKPKAYSPSDMTSAYDKYSSTIEQENSRPQIPGTPPQKKLTKQEWDKEQTDKTVGKFLAVPETLLSLGTGMIGQLAGTAAGLGAGALGKGAEDTYNKVAEALTYQPRYEAGQDLTHGIGIGMQAFGPNPYTPSMRLPKGKIPKLPVRDFEADLKAAKVAPVEVPKPITPEVMPVTQEGQAMRPEDVMWRDRAQQMQIEALKPVDDAQVEMLQQGIGEQADAVRAKRQTEMELEVKKQQQLDFNAAERARQQNAPTGYDAWVEQQRATAEQRQPGNNTPIDFEQPYPVKAADYPDVLQDAPYQYEGGVDFDAAGPKSLPVEVADTLRTGDKTPDPFARYSPQQEARRILEGDTVPKVIKGGKQAGALDFQSIVDLFPTFKNSKIQYPVYHGSTQAFNDIKASKEGGALGNGVYMAVRPEYSSMYAEGEGGNLHQSYVNISNPLIIDGPGDPMINALVTLGVTRDKAIKIVEKAYDDKGYITNEVRTRAQKLGYDGIEQRRNGKPSEIVAFSPDQVKSAISPGHKGIIRSPGNKQGGQLNIGDAYEAVTSMFTGKKVVGGTMSGKLPITGKGTPVPDSVQNPITPATIKAKQQLASAEKYARLGDSQYGDVKTIEELKAILDTRGVKDINNNPVRDYTISGVEGMVRNFPNNPIFKFVRSKLTDARNNAAMFETEYVTGTNGINKLYRAMDKNEWADVSEALQAAGRTRTVLTPEQMTKWGMNDKQQAFVLRLREALDAMHATASEALTANGMKGLDKREGYVPSIFSGAYTSLVGHTVTDGGKQKFIIRGIAQGDTKAQHAASLEYYKKQGDKFTTIVELPTRMLSGGVQKSSRVFDGFNDLVNAIAENDKDFAEVKALADTYAAERIRGLKQFNVHEKRKAGVMGSLGDRPWLSREQNAQQFLEGLVNYLDEGAKYYNYQNPLHQVTKIMNDPAIAADRPNTMKYLDRYVAHVTGQSVGAHGKFLNQVWNATLKTLGSSPAQVGTNIHRLHGAASAYMMGLWNPAFAITQMVQPAASGIPEAIGVNKITETGFAQAMSRNMIYSPIIDAALSSNNAKVLDGLPPHLVAAFKHAQDIGMTAFSESELTREVLQSKTENRINSVLHAPSQITERATRPMVFLTYVDMFHQAGFDASTSYRAAQYATDFAMTNYHPDERPMMYATFGHTGNFMGALTTYKHNLGTGMWTRSKDVATGKAFAPTAAAVSLGAALYGISGIAGYQEMDELTQLLTGKTIKETVFPVGNKLGDKPMLDGAWHGFASTASGYDFQSRLSMASALPDGPLDALSPQLSVFVDIGTKAYELFKNQDEQAALALGLAATPVGMKGIVEAKQFTDPEGFLLDASGKRKFDAPRTPQEQTVRKIIGIRPLRERLETDDLFADSKQNKKTQEKLNNHAKRFKDAILRNDEAGIDFHYQQYVDKGGDPAVLFNDKAIAKWLEDSMKSQRERQQGEPKANMGSMRKFEEYAD